MSKFNNGTDLVFTDLNEEVRQYTFPDGAIRIEKPRKLHVSASGGHRLWSEDGTSHYIPKGWLGIAWTVPEGEPNFVK